MQWIASQVELDNLLDMFVWEVCQIQNVFMLSPTYQTNSGTIAYASVPDVYMNIICNEPHPLSGVKLKFMSADIIGIPVRTELKPSAQFSVTGNEIRWAFNSDAQQIDVRCKRLEFSVLSKDEADYNEHYLIKNPFQQGGGRREF